MADSPQASNDLGLPGLPQEQLSAARAAGHSDEDIKAYWSRRYSGATPDVAPAPTEESQINRTEGEDFLPRMLASFKSTPQERTAFWKKWRGPENVTVTPAGETLVRRPVEKGGGWKAIDEKGMSFNDLADLVGDIPELAGVIASKGVLPAMPLAAAGNLVKQGISAAMPGETSFHPGDPFKAAFGGAIARFLGPAAKIDPEAPVKSLVDRFMDYRLRNVDPAVYARGQEISKTYPLNLAEQTQDPYLKMMLGFSERAGFGQEMAALDKKAKDTASLSMFERLMGQLGRPGGFGEQGFAGAAASAAQRSVLDVERALQENQTTGYGFLKTPMGTQASIIPTNRNNLIRSKIEELQNTNLPQNEAVIAELRGMLKGGEGRGVARGIVPEATPLNPLAAQQLLREYGEEGYGGQGTDLYKNLKMADGTRFDKALFATFRQDVAEAGKQPGVLGEGARSLLAARSKTDELLGLRKALEKLPVMQFLNSKGLLQPMIQRGMDPSKLIGAEGLAPTLISGMRAAPESGGITPTEIRHMLDMMTPVNPNFNFDLAAEIMNSAIRAGQAAGKGRPAQFDSQAAKAALPSPEHMQAIFGKVLTPGQESTAAGVTKTIGDFIDGVERAHVSGQGIPQPPINTYMRVLGELFKGKFMEAGKTAAGHMVAPKAVIYLMRSPEMRAEIARALNATEPEKQTFLKKYVQQSLPAVLYEGGSAVQRQNQAQAGAP